MRIVYLSSSIIPSRTANSIHVMKMSRSFAKLGHEVFLIAPDVQKGIEEGVDDVYQFYGVERTFQLFKVPMPNLKGRAYFYGLFSAIKAKLLKADLVYCRNLTAAYFASFFCKNVVFESHAPVIDSGTRYEKQFLRLISKKSFKKLVVITNALKEYYEQRYPLLVGKIHVAPDGADEFPDNVEPANLGAGENSGRLQVGYVGHLYAGKGMEVVSQLAANCPWADFHVVGGLEEDIAYWKQECTNSINITFYGFVDHSKVPSYLKAFDVVLLPNQKKVSAYGGGGDIAQWTSPLKLFEYMSAGKAIIASNLPVLAEVLDDGVNAFLCEHDDIQQWCDALVLFKDTNTREQIAQSAYDKFVSRYSWDHRAKVISDGNLIL